MASFLGLVVHVELSGFQKSMTFGSAVPGIKAVNPDPLTVMGNLMNIGLKPCRTAVVVAQKLITGVTETPPEALAVDIAAKSWIAPVAVPMKPNPPITARPLVMTV